MMFFTKKRKKGAAVIGGAGGAAAPLVFDDDFSRADGAVGNDWGGATFAIASGKVVNTPTLGPEGLTNGNFETWASATNAGNWTEFGDGGNSVNQESSDIHGGSYAARIDYANGGSNGWVMQAVSGAKTFYHADYWEKVTSGKASRFTCDTTNSDDPNMSFVGTGAWVNRKRTIRTTAAVQNLRWNKYTPNPANGTSYYIDDFSAKPLTLSQLMLTRPVYPTADYLLEVTISAMEIGTMAGMVIALDSPGTPANYVLIWHNGQTLWCKKVLSSGDFATVGSKVQAFSAGDKISVAKLGDQLKVYLNDVAISTAVTLDAGLKDNLYAGIFSTYSGNQLDDWSEQVKPLGGSTAFLAPFFSGATDGAIFAIGDSVTVGATDEVTGLGYPPLLCDLMAVQTRGYWREITPRGGHGGFDILEIQNVIDADLAATSGTATHVLMLLGANDIATAHWPTFTESTWKADYQYCIDAVHTKWTGAKIILSKSYRAGNEPNPSRLITLAGWIDDLVAANPGVCFAGIDTRTIYEGHEVELLVDDVHPNHAGFIAQAALWKTALGY